MNNFTYSKDGLHLTEQFEGCRLTAYPDPASGGDPFTIGFGHTGSDVYKGLTITQEQADALLQADIKRFSDHVNRFVLHDLTQSEFDGCVDFCFNAGCGNFDHSTLLKKINAGDTEGAANEFLKWNMAAGHVMAGLVRRRGAERSLFLGELVNA